MHGWLDLIGNDKLDGGRFKRILRIEPDHEVEDFILEITGAIYQTRRIGKGWGRRREGTRREGGGAMDRSPANSAWGKKRQSEAHLVQTFPENLYREIPRLEILGLEQLDTCPWEQVALGMGATDGEEKKRIGRDAPAALLAGSACSIWISCSSFFSLRE